MINKNLSSLLNSYYKIYNLQNSYDTQGNKFTANNYNYVISALFQLDKQASLSAYELIDKINDNNQKINQRVDDLDLDLNDRIDQLDRTTSNKAISAEIASGALSARWADESASAEWSQKAISAIESFSSYIATSSSISNHIDNSIQFIYRTIDNLENLTESYNGSIKTSISSILSSYWAVNSINSEEAISAQISEEAKKVTNSLIWISPDQDKIEFYNGSQTAILSSVLFSVSSQIAAQSLYSLSASFDEENNPINTKVQYLFSSENFDYPILFATVEASKIDANQKYNVNFHSQININPYLGAIKANYFIGTAISATYAISDYQSIPVNTRVYQTLTDNNYEYPFALSFIDANGNPIDGKNELLYTSKARINPYNDIIFVKGIPQNNDDIANNIDYYIYTGTPPISNTNNTPSKITFNINNEQVQRAYKSHQNYNINLVGLATRALYDVNGVPINEYVKTYKNSEDVWKPLIASTSSQYPNLVDNCYDQLTYSNNIIVNQYNGDMSLSGSIRAQGDLIISNKLTVQTDNIFIDKPTYINDDIYIGSSNKPINSTIYGRTNLYGYQYIDDTLEIAGNYFFVNNKFEVNNETIALCLPTYIYDHFQIGAQSPNPNNPLPTDKFSKGPVTTTMYGQLSLYGNQNIFGRLDINGEFLTINSDKFVVNTNEQKIELRFPTYIQDNITIGIPSNKSVTATIIGKIDLYGSQTISDQLNINNKLTTQYLKVNQIANFEHQLHVTNKLGITNEKIQLHRPTYIYKNINVSQNAYITGFVDISGYTKIAGNVVIGNPTSLATTTIYGTQYVTNLLEVNDNLTVSNRFRVWEQGIQMNLNVFANDVDITAKNFIGVATSAQWADLAQKYETDIQYPIGTLVQLGGEKQITIATTQVNAVISDKPAYLMNSKNSEKISF